MKKVLYNASLAVKVTQEQRNAVEHLALTRDLSIGQATREILTNGIVAMGLKA
jgi:hypothetical protein